MEKEQLINYIKKNIPNTVVTQAGLDMIAEHFEELEFLKNEYLLKQGKVSGYYYLAEGFVRAFTFDTNGNEITTFLYLKGRIALEASSFFLHLPSTEYLHKNTDCKVFATSFEKLNSCPAKNRFKCNRPVNHVLHSFASAIALPA